MANVTIHKDAEGQRALPAFEEIARKTEEVRQRAFELFNLRGAEFGHELEDWFTAEREVMGWPAAELKERESLYEMEVTLPGFAPGEVEVTATPTELIVHAASERKRSGKKENVVWTEFGANDVYRHFDLPQAVKADEITAELDNGLLRIKAPKVVRANGNAPVTEGKA